MNKNNRILVAIIMFLYASFNVSNLHSTSLKQIPYATYECIHDMTKNHPYISSTMLVGLHLCIREYVDKKKHYEKQIESSSVTSAKILLGGLLLDLINNPEKPLPGLGVIIILYCILS